MNGVLVAIIVVSGVAIVGVRRRSTAILLVAVQSAALSVGAFTLSAGRSTAFFVACLVLAGKAIAVPALLWTVKRRTPEPNLVEAARGPLVRLGVVSAVVLLTVVAIPELPHAGGSVLRMAVAVVLSGIAIVTLRRPALHQLLGVVVAENGCSLLAASVSGGLAYVIDMGALFDLLLVVTVAAAFMHRIHTLFGTGNTELLRGLRD